MRTLKRKGPRYPPLDEDLILSWADEHFRTLGAGPTSNSGCVANHEDEKWNNLDGALRYGRRGLLLGSSLQILLNERRGVPLIITGKPPLIVDNILLWGDHHRIIYGRYPKTDDGAIDGAQHETWR